MGSDRLIELIKIQLNQGTKSINIWKIIQTTGEHRNFNLYLTEQEETKISRSKKHKKRLVGMCGNK